jgi:hypothetical protein
MTRQTNEQVGPTAYRQNMLGQVPFAPHMTHAQGAFNKIYRK